MLLEKGGDGILGFGRRHTPRCRLPLLTHVSAVCLPLSTCVCCVPTALDVCVGRVCVSPLRMIVPHSRAFVRAPVRVCVCVRALAICAICARGRSTVYLLHSAPAAWPCPAANHGLNYWRRRRALSQAPWQRSSDTHNHEHPGTGASDS